MKTLLGLKNAFRQSNKNKIRVYSFLQTCPVTSLKGHLDCWYSRASATCCTWLADSPRHPYKTPSLENACSNKYEVWSHGVKSCLRQHSLLQSNATVFHKINLDIFYDICIVHGKPVKTAHAPPHFERRSVTYPPEFSVYHEWD